MAVILGNNISEESRRKKYALTYGQERPDITLSSSIRLEHCLVLMGSLILSLSIFPRIWTALSCCARDQRDCLQSVLFPSLRKPRTARSFSRHPVSRPGKPSLCPQPTVSISSSSTEAVSTFRRTVGIGPYGRQPWDSASNTSARTVVHHGNKSKTKC